LPGITTSRSAPASTVKTGGGLGAMAAALLVEAFSWARAAPAIRTVKSQTTAIPFKYMSFMQQSLPKMPPCCQGAPVGAA